MINMEEKFYRNNDGDLIFRTRDGRFYMARKNENEKETVEDCDSDAPETISQIINRFKKNQERFRCQAKTALEYTFKSLFERYPNLKKITWEQYTPFFNDGDVCYFEVYLPDFIFDSNGVDERISFIPSYHQITPNFGTTTNFDLAAKFNRESREFIEIWKTDEFEDLVKFLFGDGVIVSVTRDGIEVEEFTDHD